MGAPGIGTARRSRAGTAELEQLAGRYAHRVEFFEHRVSRAFQLGSCWHDDLRSAGFWGLFRAVSRLRADASEAERSAYVSRRIEGAVMDEARRCLARASACDVLAPDALGAAGDPLVATAIQSAGAPQDPEEQISRRMRAARIDEALGLLSAAHRRVLRAYMAGFSVREIAEREDVPLGTMRSRLQRIARELRGKAPHIRRVLLDQEPRLDGTAPPTAR